ncbi:MAG: hypothetical protein HC877_15970 [Thioploca sp.]|nr:hypothetical protein [Thioploca sp.]
MLTQNKNMSWLSSLFLARPLRQQYFNFLSRQEQNCTLIHFSYPYKNSLTGNISNLDPVINLLGLYLSDIQLTGTIPNLTALSNLQEPVLSCSIPDLKGLTSRQFLYQTDNQLSSTIPKLSTFSLSTLSHLSSKPLFSLPG